MNFLIKVNTKFLNYQGLKKCLITKSKIVILLGIQYKKKINIQFSHLLGIENIF